MRSEKLSQYVRITTRVGIDFPSRFYEMTPKYIVLKDSIQSQKWRLLASFFTPKYLFKVSVYFCLKLFFFFCRYVVFSWDWIINATKNGSLHKFNRLFPEISVFKLLCLLANSDKGKKKICIGFLSPSQHEYLVSSEFLHLKRRLSPKTPK